MKRGKSFQGVSIVLLFNLDGGWTTQVKELNLRLNCDPVHRVRRIRASQVSAEHCTEHAPERAR